MGACVASRNPPQGDLSAPDCGKERLRRPGATREKHMETARPRVHPGTRATTKATVATLSKPRDGITSQRYYAGQVEPAWALTPARTPPGAGGHFRLARH